MNVWIPSKQPFPPAAGKESVSSVCHVPLCTKSTHGHSIERRLRKVTKVFMRKLQACRSIPSLKYKNIDHDVLEPTISLKEIPSEPTDALK